MFWFWKKAMETRLSFLGAARNVTGSKYLIEAGDTRVLVDCGMYQERRLKDRNWQPFPVTPGKVDAMLLTHGHLDHCGLLPKFVREGFRGKIYCTEATAEIARIVLLDSAHIQEEDAKYKKKRHEREGREGPYPEVPLYTTEEAEAVLPLFSPVKYGESIRPGNGLEVRLRDAGHILGSAILEVLLDGDGERMTLLFSGDLGRPGKPILRDPATIDAADYVVVESTYGDRLHEDPGDIEEMLADIVNSTRETGGNVVIPAFSIERTQELLYHLGGLIREDRIPHLPIFVDSPMAIRVTEVFQNHTELFDKEMGELLRRGDSPFDLPNLWMSRTVKESKAINHIRGTAIIIAGSGMCTGGRIKHHLAHNIERPESTVLFVGFQAQGTLGGQISRGEKKARILGREYEVKARVEQIHGFSAHADRDELLQWLSALKEAPRRVFVTHGEEEAALSFAALLEEEKGWQTTAPEYKDVVRLE